MTTQSSHQTAPPAVEAELLKSLDVARMLSIGDAHALALVAVWQDAQARQDRRRRGAVSDSGTPGLD